MVAATRALHQACRQGRLVAVEAALRQGADVHATYKEGYTALHHLALCTTIDPEVYKGILRCLMEAGVDLNALTSNHDSAAHLAAGNDHWLLMDHLVEQGASVHPGVANADGHELLLSRAAELGPLRSVKTLLDHGANVNASDGDGHTALGLVAWCMGPERNPVVLERWMQVMDLLMERGASVTGVSTSSPFVTPLGLAVEHRSTIALPRLIERGAWRDDPRWQDSANQVALLRLAIHKANAQALRVLVDQGVGQDWPVETWATLAREAQHVVNQPSTIPPHLQPAAERQQEQDRRAQGLAVLEDVLLRREARTAGDDGPRVSPTIRERSRL